MDEKLLARQKAKEQQKRKSEICGNHASDCQRTFWIAELFVPQNIWDQIQLCERITTEGIASVLASDGRDLEEMTQELASLLMSVIHKGDQSGGR